MCYSLRLQLWTDLCLVPWSAIMTGRLLLLSGTMCCCEVSTYLGKADPWEGLIFILLLTLLKQVTWSGAVFLHIWTFCIFWTFPTSNILSHYPHKYAYICPFMYLIFVFRTERQKEIKIASVFSLLSNHSRMLGDSKWTHKCVCGETKVWGSCQLFGGGKQLVK